MSRRVAGRSAAVLVLVLWAIVVLSLVAGGVSFVLKQDLAIANLQRDRVVAHQLARAGVARAIAEVMDDTDATDTLADYWADDPSIFEGIALVGGTFSVIADDHRPLPAGRFGAGDECGKLNVNTATREQLAALPDATNAIVGAIIDWRDRNEQPEPDGIERGHYGSLPHPYTIRNGPLRTVRELLLVRGIDEHLLYGEDRNTNGLLDDNENDGDASPPPDNADGRLDRGWFAYLTVYSYDKNVDSGGQPRLNINNASAGDFQARLSLEQWAAESIVKAREQKEFEHLSDLLDVTRPADVQRGADDIDYYARNQREKDQPVTESIFAQIVDRLTLKDDKTLVGLLNVNTAPRAVLRTLPGVDDQLADAIIRERDAGAGFTTIGDLLQVAGMTKDIFARLEQHVTVRSWVFRIHSRGLTDSGLARASIECVVDRGGDTPRVLYWRESTP